MSAVAHDAGGVGEERPAEPAAPAAEPTPPLAAKKAEVKPAKPTKAAKLDKPAKPAKDEKLEKAAKAEKSGKGEKAAVAAKAAKPAKEKPVKLPREKVVRDSFSMPKSEHAQLKALRESLAKGGRICTKSELLRAGVQLLLKASLADAKALVEGLPVVPKGKGAK